jgi:hypothetical protein
MSSTSLVLFDPFLAFWGCSCPHFNFSSQIPILVLLQPIQMLSVPFNGPFHIQHDPFLIELGLDVVNQHPDVLGKFIRLELVHGHVKQT